MSDNVQGFKRINFFKGFLTTEKDWNDAERYHIDKRRLHNRMMHSPGVIHGYSGERRVTARARGDLSVEVQPGYAIDGMGNDLMIFDATIRNINLEEFKLPQTIYIVLRYYEELTDFIAYKENLEYKGHRRVAESVRVEIVQTEPDIHQEVELGRVALEKGATRIRDARDPNDPRRHIGIGQPLIGTSWRNRPIYFGSFVGGIMMDDIASNRLARDVVKKIEEQLQYPGQIKVTVIRETRAVDYAR